MKKTGIILAAGESRRFGSQKLLYEIEGIPVICRTVRNSLHSSLDNLIIVTGADRSKVEGVVKKSFPNERKISFVHNKYHSRGMISSFLKGLDLIDRGAQEVMMILGDMPFVSGKLMDIILLSKEKSCFVVPRVNNELTHPRVIPSESFSRFRQLDQGDSGKEVLDYFRKSIIEINFGDSADFSDIDFPRDVTEEPV